MPNKLVLTGVDALTRELDALPTRLREQSAGILLRHAQTAATNLRAAYPIVTGALRAGVRVVPRSARGLAAAWSVVSSAPYAHIFEFGSRFLRPHAAFWPHTERERRASVAAVAADVETTGLKVTGARD